MGVDPERGDDAGVVVGDRQCSSARVDAGADGHHAGHAGRAGALEQLGGRYVAGVEVRVRVGHAAADRSMRSSSVATTVAASSFAKSGVGSRSACPGCKPLGAQRPIHDA